FRSARQKPIENGGEIHVESQEGTRLTLELTRQTSHSEPRRVSKRDRRTQNVAQSIDGATLLIEAEERAPGQSVDLFRQIANLIGALDVSAKEDDGPRRGALEDVPFFGRQSRPRCSDADEPRPHEPLTKAA